MRTTNVYLNFDGNCRAAMTFYGQCLNAQPGFTRYADGPPDFCVDAKSTPDRILHAELHSGPFVLMASDTMPGMDFKPGNNFSISLSCESLAEMEKLFAAFSEHGKVILPMHDAFWGGRFGMLTDQFGIKWMFSYRASEQLA